MTLICNKCKEEFDDIEQEQNYIDIGDTCPDCRDGELEAIEQKDIFIDDYYETLYGDYDI
jgi:Zn finger protein HypA/HybF involved in hydrogenase expression